ncbi:MAG: hypothetical protein HY890_06550 [Deltaproteobacteria bacterium]|nr:hypothetical protein [Deltaproteobacteria bacterium]
MRNNWRTITIGTAVSWLMRVFLFWLLLYKVYREDYLFAFGVYLGIAFSLIPGLTEKNFRIQLPFELDLLITLALFLHTFFGEWLRFYERVEGWDKFLHLYGTAVTALYAFIVVYSFHYTRKLRLTLPFIGLFTIVFAMALGAMWEIFEFAVDSLFAKSMQNGLSDTMWDMIYDFIGGAVVSVLGMLYVRYSTPPESRKRLSRPIGEVLKESRHLNDTSDATRPPRL